jgi:hypothetical protein
MTRHHHNAPAVSHSTMALPAWHESCTFEVDNWTTPKPIMLRNTVLAGAAGLICMGASAAAYEGTSPFIVRSSAPLVKA